MSIIKEIPDLIKAGVISHETADNIRNYCNEKKGQSYNRLFIIFGVFGAILIGLGIILIIAHNWDELSRTAKTLFAFIPLIVGQALCVFSLIKKQDSVTWRESGTAFLFFAVGACISLISQIYNIPGNLSTFLLTWMLLCLPLIYVMRSSIASLLYLIGITYYACEASYFSYPSSDAYIYWILLLAALPHYYLLYKNKPRGNFMVFHNWLIPLSIIITLGTVAKNNEELLFIAYFSLFGLFYLVGNMEFFKEQKAKNNGYLTIGSLGSVVLLLTLSFDWFWEDLRNQDLLFNEVIVSPEFITSAIVSLFATGLLYLRVKKNLINKINPIEPVFILFIIVFIIGVFSPLSVILINVIAFALGILLIIKGAKSDHLGIMNYGLLIITALVVCRFFDTDLSFVLRGILFVSVGVGFFATNYWMLKKRKTNE